MPYIKFVTNQPLPADKREQIKNQMGTDVAILSKTEDWLMVDFCENSPLFFKGTDAAAALVSVDVYGAADAAAYERFTAAVCALLGQVAGIPAERVFVKYGEYQHWGWNGRNL